MNYLRSYDGRLFFDFTCEKCGSHGELGIPEEHALRPVTCPEECGAVYLVCCSSTKDYYLRSADNFSSSYVEALANIRY
jgi:hypothetical protein